MRDVADQLQHTYRLDRRWHWLRGGMDTTKQQSLETLVRILADVPYALIGGVAVQIHREEPRTTLDIDVAILDRSLLPREALLAGGFALTGRFDCPSGLTGRTCGAVF